jgi:ATP-binding cassette subfamily F protein uup
MITGGLKPDSGNIEKVKQPYWAISTSRVCTFKEEERVIDIVKNVAEFITMADGKMISASALLTLFLFPPVKQYGFVSKLSGGEKKRLQLMGILMKNPNFLILDEPTNDLDIDTLNVLEEFLTNYPGVLMIVSHDRYLLDKLTEQLFIVEEKGHVRVYNGNYSSYRLEQEDQKQQDRADKAAGVTPSSTTTAAPKNKLSFKQQKELETLEKEIALLEGQIKDLNAKLNSGLDNSAIVDTAKKITDLTNDLEEKTMRWLELTELKEA